MKKLTRQCPKCLNDITYTHSSNLCRANRENSICKNCSKVKRRKNIGVCSICKVRKNHSEFYSKNSRGKQIISSVCKRCFNIKVKENMVGEFSRVCPKCNQNIFYTNRKSYKNAERNKSSCRPCFMKTRKCTIIEENSEKVIEMFVKDMMTCKEIAKYFSCHSQNVGKILIKNGIKTQGYNLYSDPNNQNKFFGQAEILDSKWTQIRLSANKREIPFIITKKEAIEILHRQNYKCELSGVNIELAKFHRDSPTASLDRINSELGYTKENCQWVHKAINSIKWINTDKELFLWAKKVYLHNISGNRYLEKLNIESLYHRLFHSYKLRAKKQEILFDISPNDVIKQYNLQGGRCLLTGEKLEFKSARNDCSKNASIDRIDSLRGYTVDNIQILHKDINRMKWDYSQSEFINWCTLVYKHLQPKYETAYWN